MRRLAIVSGMPGAGKTSLARPLAQALGFVLVSKDELKETLFDHIPAPAGLTRPDWSRQLGGAAMEMLWRLAAQAPAAVLEANFRPRSAYERAKLAALDAAIVEAHCRCPPEVAIARYNARGATPERHGVHPAAVDPAGVAAFAAEFEGPIGLFPLIEVDTTREADVERVARQVRAAFENAGA